MCFMHRLITAVRSYWDEGKRKRPGAISSEGEHTHTHTNISCFLLALKSQLCSGISLLFDRNGWVKSQIQLCCCFSTVKHRRAESRDVERKLLIIHSILHDAYRGYIYCPFVLPSCLSYLLAYLLTFSLRRGFRSSVNFVKK